MSSYTLVHIGATPFRMWVWRRRRSAGAEENLVDEDSDCRPPPYSAVCSIRGRASILSCRGQTIGNGSLAGRSSHSHNRPARIRMMFGAACQRKELHIATPPYPGHQPEFEHGCDRRY